jgi:hypothetical protein
VKYTQCVKNMVVSEVCAVSDVLCSIFDGHYTESDNCLVSDEEQGRCAHATRVSYLTRRDMPRETRVSYLRNVHLPLT